MTTRYSNFLYGSNLHESSFQVHIGASIYFYTDVSNSIHFFFIEKDPLQFTIYIKYAFADLQGTRTTHLYLHISAHKGKSFEMLSFIAI